MKPLRTVFAALAAMTALAASAANPPSGSKDVTTYSSSDYYSGFASLVPNDRSKASANGASLNNMIKASANTVLYFPPGTYWIDRTVEVAQSGVTLWGAEGAVICRTGVPNTNATAFPLGEFKAVANFWITASNFKMHGLTIRYDVPTSFTGVITALNGSTAAVRLTDGQSGSFSASTCISRVNYFDDNLRPYGSETFFDAGSKLNISNVQTGSDGVKTFNCTLTTPMVGQRLGMACGSNYGQNIVLWGEYCIDNAVFEDVTVANSFGMVMLVRGVRNLTLERFRVDDGNPDTIYTASVDGIHVTALGGKLKMKDCVFNGLADDMLNVHCNGAKVGSVSGSRVTFASGVESVYFQNGHTVRFYSAALKDLGTAKVTSASVSSGTVTAITVDALPSGVASGCHVANEDWLPEVEITGTKIGVTRARGLLLQTDRKVTVADCEFENTRLAGILCAPGAAWGELGPVNGVTITNCTFRSCGVGEPSYANKGNAAITLRPEHDADNPGSYVKTVNRNVWVGDCRFEDCSAAAVGAANVSGLVVTNNVFLRCGGKVPEQDSCMVRLKTCDNAKVVFNKAQGGCYTNDVMNLSSTNVEVHDNGFRHPGDAEAVIEYGQLDKSAFAKKMDVAFSGYSGAVLTDFPVLVKLSTAINGFSYGDFLMPDGGDLRFADSAGRLLPHEIDTWNPNGVSTVWVKVPTLSPDARITACYGCASPPEVAAKDVWDDDYVGVWHLGDGAATLTMKESTCTTLDLTSYGSGTDLAASGIVGGAVDFREYNKSRYLSAPDQDALDGFSACTLEAWTYQTNQCANSGILGKRVSYANNVSYQIYDSGSGTPSVALYMGTNSTSAVSAGVMLSPELNKWNHLVYTFNRGTVTGYRNGAAGAAKTFPRSTVIAGTGKFCVGNFDASDARNFPGKIDEVRISKVARSAAWVKATHDTIASDNFATYAVDGIAPDEPEEPDDPDPVEPTVVSASDAAGFDWTNRLVTVTGLTAGASVTLTVAGTGGTAAAEYTATADASGVATFDVPTAPRVAYEYSVSQDGETVASGAFLSGGWKDSWFAASAASGESVVVNGEWDTEPQILASGGYAFDGGESGLFSLGEAAAEKGRGALARVDMSVVFLDIDEKSSLGSYGAAVGCLAAATDGASDGTAAWMAFDGSAWRPLSGRGASAAPRTDAPYVVRAEADFAASPALVRYFVSDDGGGTFAALVDGEGNDFIRCAAPPDSSGLSGLAFDGCGTVASFEGSLAGADVAEADGEGYESLADAIASATNSLVLLTNAMFPTNAPVGTVAVDGGGFSLAGVALDGSGNAVVQSGYSAIPGEGRINISLAQVGGLGVATGGKKTPAEIASALAENGANGIPRWKSYVLGLDPADSAAKPKASIAVNGGKVELSLVGIEVNAASGATVTYRVLAAEDVKDIADAQPVEGVAPASAGAAVELPKDDSKPQMFYRLEIDVKGF